MRFQTTREVLEHAVKFHHEVTDYYKKLSNSAERERVKLLMTYLIRHEKLLEENLKEFAEDIPQQIMDTWFQFVPEVSTLKTSDITFRPDMNIDELIHTATKFSDYLINLYDEMSRDAENKSIHMIFKNLLESETNEKKKLIRNAMMVKEI